MERIEVRILHQDVAGKLREMIRKGVLIRGQRIVEADICAEIGVSRTPLREALRVLESEGLVELIPHRGAYIRKPSKTEINEMFEVMGLLESACARLAAQKMNAAAFGRFERLHRRIEKYYAAGDRDKYIAANNQLHAFIQELAGNSVLDDIVGKLRRKVALYRHQQIYAPRRLDESMAEHREILEAFRRRDSAAAEAAMKNHLEQQGKALLRIFQTSAEN